MNEQQRKAMELSLEALTATMSTHGFRDAIDDVHDKAITAIKEALAQDALQALHDENKRLGLYEKGYADAMNWKVQNHLEHLPAAQPEQEPMAFLVYAKGCRRYFTLTFDVEKVPEIYKGGKCVPLYTTPPQEQRSCDMRTWVGLTDEEINKIRFDWLHYEERAKAIEAKLKEKNI